MTTGSTSHHIDHYTRFGTQYVALGGDEKAVPVRYCDPRSSNVFMPVDLYYADADGGDWDENNNSVFGEAEDITETELTPDVHLGRIPIRTIEQAEAYVKKVVVYETAPSDGFANSMILFGAWGMSSGNARPGDFAHHDPVSGAELRQMRMYYDFIQPSRQAMPLHFLWDAYSSWDVNTCGDYEFTRDRLIEKVNQGHHFLFCWGHGNGGLWGMEGRRFGIEHAAALTNSIPSIVFSFSCSPGHFDSEGTCLTEAFIQNPHGGAVAYFGHTRAAGGGDKDCQQLFPAMSRGTDGTTGEIISGILATLAAKRVSDPYKQYNITLHGDSCIQLLAEESGRHLQLFQPKGCEVLQERSDLIIRWNAAGTGFESYEAVKLDCSLDSGETWAAIPGAEALPYNGCVFTGRTAICPSDRTTAFALAL